MDDKTQIPALFTIKDFSRKHRTFTESGLRWLVFRMSGGDYGQPHKNPARGLAESGAIVRLGRRVLIDEVLFFAWVSNQQKMRTLHPNTIGESKKAA